MNLNCWLKQNKAYLLLNQLLIFKKRSFLNTYFITSFLALFTISIMVLEGHWLYISWQVTSFSFASFLASPSSSKIKLMSSGIFMNSEIWNKKGTVKISLVYPFYLEHVVHHICEFESIFSPGNKIDSVEHNETTNQSHGVLASKSHRWPFSGNQSMTQWCLPWCNYHSSMLTTP